MESDACNGAESIDLLEPDFGEPEPDFSISAPATKMCCIESRIYQPQNSSLLKKIEKVYGSGENIRTRHLNPTWFKSYSMAPFLLDFNDSLLPLL